MDKVPRGTTSTGRTDLIRHGIRHRSDSHCLALDSYLSTAPRLSPGISLRADIEFEVPWPDTMHSTHHAPRGSPIRTHAGLHAHRGLMFGTLRGSQSAWLLMRGHAPGPSSACARRSRVGPLLSARPPSPRVCAIRHLTVIALTAAENHCPGRNTPMG